MSTTDTIPETQKIRGDALAKDVRQAVAARAAVLTAAGLKPKMAVILASEDPASLSYSQSKQRTAAQLGIELDIHDLGSDTTQERLEETCRALSLDATVHGMLLELPLAPHLHGDRALDLIAPAKDIDGLTAYSMGLITTGREDEALTSATAQACILLAETRGSVAGKRVAVIGRGRTVGRPLASMLVNRHATVTVCHSRTRDLAAVVAECELVFVAIGRAHQIGRAQVRAGQILIDAGINYLNGKLVGDLDAAAVEGLAAALTPVPGGVGPLTSALIFQNLIRAAERQQADLTTQ